MRILSFILVKLIKLIKNNLKGRSEKMAEETFLKDFLQTRKSIYQEDLILMDLSELIQKGTTIFE